MKKRYISIVLLVLIALAFVALFFRACQKPSAKHQSPTTQYTDTIPGEVVVAPANPPDTVRDPALEGQVRHFRARYEHYKGMATALQERLQALDAALADSLLTCEERVALLRDKIAAQDEAVGVASGHIEELSTALEPKRDTGSETTAAYRFAWEINHFGELMDGGFRYKIDALPQAYTCPECPQPLTPKGEPKRRNLTGFYGMGLNGRQRYGMEARRQWRRVSVSGLVVWDGAPSGLVGVGWSW
jgi:hypothetical protein